MKSIVVFALGVLASATLTGVCHDCAAVTEGDCRVFLGGSHNDIASTLLSASRHMSAPEYHGVVGARCARSH